MYLLLCVVTTFFIPTAKHVMGGRAVLGMVSMRISSETLLPFLPSGPPFVFWELDSMLPPTMQLERTLPVFWSKMRSTPSIPPTTKVDVSFRRCCKEYTTLGLTRVSHTDLIVLKGMTLQPNLRGKCYQAKELALAVEFIKQYLKLIFAYLRSQQDVYPAVDPANTRCELAWWHKLLMPEGGSWKVKYSFLLAGKLSIYPPTYEKYNTNSIGRVAHA